MIAKTSRYGARILQRSGGHRPRHAIRETLIATRHYLPPRYQVVTFKVIHRISRAKLKSERFAARAASPFQPEAICQVGFAT